VDADKSKREAKADTHAAAGGGPLPRMECIPIPIMEGEDMSHLNSLLRRIREQGGKGKPPQPKK
jgi:hypothetical protein